MTPPPVFHLAKARDLTCIEVTENHTRVLSRAPRINVSRPAPQAACCVASDFVDIAQLKIQAGIL